MSKHPLLDATSAAPHRPSLFPLAVGAALLLLSGGLVVWVLRRRAPGPLLPQGQPAQLQTAAVQGQPAQSPALETSIAPAPGANFAGASDWRQVGQMAAAQGQPAQNPAPQTSIAPAPGTNFAGAPDWRQMGQMAAQPRSIYPAPGQPPGPGQIPVGAMPTQQSAAPTPAAGAWLAPEQKPHVGYYDGQGQWREADLSLDEVRHLAYRTKVWVLLAVPGGPPPTWQAYRGLVLAPGQTAPPMEGLA